MTISFLTISVQEYKHISMNLNESQGSRTVEAHHQAGGASKRLFPTTTVPGRKSADPGPSVQQMPIPQSTLSHML